MVKDFLCQDGIFLDESTRHKGYLMGSDNATDNFLSLFARILH